MSDDRDALIDRTGDTLETAFARGLASPEGRAAYADLTRHGGTLTVNGREINPETGEVGGGERRRDRTGWDDERQDKERKGPDPATRDARLAGFVGPGDPDTRIYAPMVGKGIDLGKRKVYLSFVEDPYLTSIGEALLVRDTKIASFDAWSLNLAFRWGENLGKLGGEPRLWRLKKPSDDVVWALGQSDEPRVIDLFVDVNSRVARYAEFIGWQVQAALHEALGCAKVRDGRVAIEPLSPFWQEHIMRRYGPRWRPDLAHLLEMMRLAEGEQLPLWEDEAEDEDVSEG